MKNDRVWQRAMHNPAILRRAGFTLIEMVVSLSVISIIFLAMGSVMVLASKAHPSSASAAAQTFGAADVLQQMASELEVATSVTGTADKRITFTVPDRDGNGRDETISYGWIGKSGSPLVRKYNSGTAVNILPAVYEFNLTYDAESVPQPDLLVESDEVRFSSKTSVINQGDFDVKEKEWIGQYFEPDGLPAEAAAWSVTRVLFVAIQKDTADGVTLVQLREATDHGLPTDTVLGEMPMYESDLHSSFYTWQTFNYSNVRDLKPGVGLCLVLKCRLNPVSAYVYYDKDSGDGLFVSKDTGASWSRVSGEEMAHQIYGTYSVPVPQPPLKMLRSVTITLNPGSDPASRVRTAVTLLNQPEVQ
jgi:prepilin-type N-terminal cleavage/methylation domain-containing protein